MLSALGYFLSSTFSVKNRHSRPPKLAASPASYTADCAFSPHSSKSELHLGDMMLRDSASPVIKCSDCGASVRIIDVGEHICGPPTMTLDQRRSPSPRPTANPYSSIGALLHRSDTRGSESSTHSLHRQLDPKPNFSPPRHDRSNTPGMHFAALFLADLAHRPWSFISVSSPVPLLTSRSLCPLLQPLRSHLRRLTKRCTRITIFI